ncbi:hypothetical protein B0J12DRAFT_151271 [Macrophomina phaseolina]|uniref:Alcohol dehydrogenase superfamily zinc-containing n=1 Tax=Macrophomina phaseolina TaxID=35725 RepID=A0ABQ8G4X2_9PEZI|nr:hypothetical protein B0J12DRAFT_151271 [Macrophomina phaseolina]
MTTVLRNFAAKQAEAVWARSDQDRPAHTDISTLAATVANCQTTAAKNMEALMWIGKIDCRFGRQFLWVASARPPAESQVGTSIAKIVHDHDVIKVTETTVCGSDIHIMPGVIVQVAEGEVLCHEFRSIVDSVRPTITQGFEGRQPYSQQRDVIYGHNSSRCCSP